MVAIVVRVLLEALETELLRLLEATVEAKAVLKDLNKDKTEDQPVKLPGLKDPKITVLPGLKTRLPDHKGPLVKRLDPKGPPKGLLEVKTVEVKTVEVKEVKDDLKAKLPDLKDLLKDPKDLKLKAPLPDPNKRLIKGHLKAPSNNLIQ